ncbi:Uncharacterised protein [uncultured archaeon]|nr:Uncharacterised protein [uncultured archaeon]
MLHEPPQLRIGYLGLALIQAGLEVVQDYQELLLVEDAHQSRCFDPEGHGLVENLVQGLNPGHVQKGVDSVEDVLRSGLRIAFVRIDTLEMAVHPNGQASGQNRFADAAPSMHDGCPLHARAEGLLQDAKLLLPANEALPHHLDLPQHEGLLEEFSVSRLYAINMQAVGVQEI